jgi:FkbM family methyltransferase
VNAELAVLRALGRALPKVRGAGRVGNLLRDVYARRPRPRVIAEVRGATFELDPMENVDGSLLFFPQLYDRRELDHLLPRLRPGDVFVDVGAHIGLYAILAARRVGASGRSIALEADPVNHRRLLRNVRLNPGLRVDTMCVGVSDRTETARLAINTTGNRAGNSLLGDGPEGTEIRCRPLRDTLAELGVERVGAMKLDVEGMEYRILERYLADAPEDGWPRTIVMEFHPSWVGVAGGSSVELLLSHGYREILRAGENRVLERP